MSEHPLSAMMVAMLQAMGISRPKDEYPEEINQACAYLEQTIRFVLWKIEKESDGE